MTTTQGRIRRALAVAVFAMFLVGAPTFAATVNAQPRPVTIEWDYLGAVPSVVSTWTQTITLDGTLITTPPTCRPRTGSATDTTCAITVPPLASGSHSIEIATASNFVTISTKVVGADFSRGPRGADNVRFILQLTITLP